LNRGATLLPLDVMGPRRLVRLLLLLLPIGLIGGHFTRAPSETGIGLAPVSFGPSVFISTPRQSLPTPVHDEATCAFCQAAAFAPHTGGPTAGVPLVTGSETYHAPARDERLTHSTSSRPPRSRAPPSLRDV
jgi:hypothetical protein